MRCGKGRERERAERPVRTLVDVSLGNPKLSFEQFWKLFGKLCL